MTASAMLLGSLLLLWATLRLRSRWVAWGAIAPVFLALGLLPVHGAAEDPSLEVGATGRAAQYSVCGTTHHLRSAGGRASYLHPVNEHLAVTGAASGEVAEHEAVPSTGLPSTDTEGYAMARVGAFNRWGSAQLGVGVLVQTRERAQLSARPSAALHLGPYDMVYLSAYYMDHYVDAAAASGRMGVTAVIPVAALQRWELGLGVTPLGVYTETLVRSQQGFGLSLMGANSRDGSGQWQVNLGLSYRAPLKDY